MTGYRVSLALLCFSYFCAAMKPFSLDIFEDKLYWVAKEKGEVWRQNKFGKENKEKVLVVNPWLTQVRIFHQLRYNQSGEYQPREEILEYWIQCQWMRRVIMAEWFWLGASNILSVGREHSRLNEKI